MKKKRKKRKVSIKTPMPKKKSILYKLKFLMKRAQMAMEYVLTYGWAVLIILFALSSLFYIGVFDTKGPNICLMDIPFLCNDVKAYDDTIEYIITAPNTKSVTVNQMLINGQSCTDASNLGDLGLIINPGEENQGVFDVNSQNQIICLGLEQDLYKQASSEIILNYESQQGLEHSLTGTASVNIEGSGFIFDYALLNDPNMAVGFNFENGFEVLGGGYAGTVIEHGTITFPPELVIEKTAYFDGTAYVELQNQPILNSDLLTIEFLIKFEDTPILEYPILVKEDQNRFNYGFYFDLNNKLLMKVNTNGCIAIVDSNPLNLDEWYYVTGTFDGNRLYLYLNGEQIREAIPCSPKILQNPVDIYIGTDFSRSEFLKGSLDSIVVYKDFLSPKEIKTHYKHFTPPDAGGFLGLF
ncbi:MAG: LamG domain-containing protein [Nanoarchaeota archaeon]|nr:LamG domain-containing protein [Nanoarchaeota archaeon]